MKKALLVAISLVFILTLCSCVPETSIEKQVPVYEGMTVYSTTDVAGINNIGLELFSNTKITNNGDIDIYNASKGKDDLNPEGCNYYADLNEDVYIHIHINNPDEFEILSFTLNGEKYSSYMFEYGSNMEVIIIKVNVGRESGIKEYTIDAIKYIDKQAIKDVIIHGEKTISIFVSDTEYVPDEPEVTPACKHEDNTQIVFLEEKKATCTSTGLTAGQYCSACGTTLIAQQEVPVQSHKYDDEYDQNCNVCGYNRKQDYPDNDYGNYSESQGLVFRLINDGASYSVSGIGTCTDSVLVIPSVNEGLPVTVIEYGAFAYCTHITTVIIPNTVNYIVDYAFVECTALETVIVSESVWYIEPLAFDRCTNIKCFDVDLNNPNYKSLNGNLYSSGGSEMVLYAVGKTDSQFIVPNGVTQIDSNAFNNAKFLEEIILPESVTYIGSYAFGNCSSLWSINLPDSISEIGEGAFIYCSSLQNIILPNSLTVVADSVFSDCSSLSSVAMGDNVISIGSSAFYGCFSLSYVTLSNTLESIGNMAFGGCTSLQEISLPDSVNYIDDSAFVQCESLTSIKLPSSITKINANTFSRCISLESITISQNVTAIDNEAFFWCSSLLYIYFEGTTEQWNNIVFADGWNSDISASEVVCDDGTLPLY